MAIVVKGECGEIKERIRFDYFRKDYGRSRHKNSSPKLFLSSSGSSRIKVELYKIVLRTDESEKYMLVLIGDDIKLKFSKDEKTLYPIPNCMPYEGDIIKQSFASKNRRYFSYPKIFEMTGGGIFPLKKIDENLYKIIHPKK